MSMKHPEIGEWLAYLDGESGGETARLTAHLDACGECAEVVAELRRSAQTFTQALGLLDLPSAEVEGALATVKATRRVPRAEARRATTAAGVRWWSRPLSRAAAVILAFGVLASGLPGSPVRAWLEERSASAPATAVPEDVPVVTEAGDPGVRITPADGRARVNVQGLSETGEVVVRIVDGGMVSVYATAGASFATDAGRVLVTDAGAHVMIEFPRAVADGAVEVSGEVIFRKLGDVVETADGERSPVDSDEIRIRP